MVSSYRYSISRLLLWIKHVFGLELDKKERMNEESRDKCEVSRMHKNETNQLPLGHMTRLEYLPIFTF